MNKIWKIGTDIHSYINEVSQLSKLHGNSFELRHKNGGNGIELKFSDGHVETKTSSTASQFIRVLLALELIEGNKGFYNYDKYVLQDDDFSIMILNDGESLGDYLCLSLKNKVLRIYKDEKILFPSEKKLIFSIMATIFASINQKDKKFINLRINNSKISDIEKYYLSIKRIVSESSLFKDLISGTREYIVGFTEEASKVIESVNDISSKYTNIIYSESNLDEQIVSKPETFGMFMESYFAKKTKIEIPVYQRKYIWPESTVKTLLNDIKDIGNQMGTHYMGNIIVKKINIGIESVFRIIDGQQRITTLTLISRAMFDFAKYKRFPVDRDFNTRVSIEGKDDKGNPINQIIKTFMRVKGNSDYDAFKLVMRGEAFSNDANLNSSQIIENYKVILNWITQNISSLDEFINFWKSLLNKITMVLIDSKSSNEYKLFEKLNTGAEPLTTLELFKNYILDSFSNENLSDKYSQGLFEEKIESHFNVKNKGQEIDKFIITYLRVNNSLVGNETIFNQFKDLIEQQYINNRPTYTLNNVLDKISQDILLYKSISTYSSYIEKTSWAYYFADFFYMFDGRVVYFPLFIRLIKYHMPEFEKFNIDKINYLREFFKVIEIFEVRMQVANYRGQSLSNTIEQILINFNENTTPKDLWYMFKDIKSKSIGMPPIDYLAEQLATSPIANKPAKLVMTRLENYFVLKNNWEIDSEDTEFVAMYKKPSQREHLLPFEWKEFWGKYLESHTGKNGIELEELVVKYNDFIGNAFPIPAWSNNNVKNKSLDFKVNKFKKANYSKFISIFNGIKDQLDPVGKNFGPEIIKERSKQISKIAKKMWKDPYE